MHFIVIDRNFSSFASYTISPIFILVCTYLRDGVLDDFFTSSFSESLVLFVKRVSTARTHPHLFPSLHLLLHSLSTTLRLSLILPLSITSFIYIYLSSLLLIFPVLLSSISFSFPRHAYDTCHTQICMDVTHTVILSFVRTYIHIISLLHTLNHWISVCRPICLSTFPHFF